MGIKIDQLAGIFADLTGLDKEASKKLILDTDIGKAVNNGDIKNMYDNSTKNINDTYSELKKMDKKLKKSNISVKDISKSVKKVLNEEDVSLEEVKLSYKIKNIDCAACGTKVEHQVSKLNHVKSCSYNFMTEKISVTVPSDINEEELHSQILKIARKISRHCTVERI